MCICNIKYYTLLFVLAILIFKYQALENRVKSDNELSLNLLQNDLLYNPENAMKHDTMIDSLNENGGTNYRQKRQAAKQQGNNRNKPGAKRPPVRIPLSRIPLSRRPPVRRPPPRKPPVRRPPLQKPPIQKPPLRRPQHRRTTRRKPHLKPTTRRPLPRPTTKKLPPKPKPITRVTVPPTQRPQPIPTTKIIVPQTQKPAPIPITTSKPTTTTSKEIYPNLKAKLLSDINGIRNKHQAPPLTYDNELAEKARKHLDLVIKNRGAEPIDDESIGILFYITRSEDQFDPVDFWIKGTDDIDYDHIEQARVPYDFAQLVWVSTTKIGCGFKKDEESNSIFTLCFLTPPGAIEGEFERNVRRPVHG